MAEIKYKFKGIARFNAFLLFSAMSGGPLAFLTTGILGTITFKFLELVGNWFANQGLALLNIGVDAIMVAAEQNKYESVINRAIERVKNHKGPMPEKLKREIDNEVIDAVRDFIRFV